MRLFGIFFILLSFGSLSFSAPTYDYKKLWLKENLHSKTVKLTVFSKHSVLKNIDNIATATISEGNKDSAETILSLLKKSLGQEKWTTDKIDGLDIYEKFDVSSMTLFRLAYNQKTKQFSMGAVKTRFLLPSYAELHLLQVENLTQQPSKKTAAFLFDLIISKAVASKLADTVQNYIAETGQQALAPTDASIDGVANSINRTGDKVNDASDKISNTFSTKHVASLAAVATLSAAVTSTLYTFITSASYKAARTLYYEAIGEFTPEEKKAKIESFEVSMKTFAELSPQIEKLEQKLTLVSANMKALTGEPTEVTLAKLDADIAAQKARLTQGGTDCVECLEKEVAGKIAEFEDMKKAIKAAGVDTARKKGEICSDVDQMYQAWTDAEMKISQARRYIIQDARVYMGLVNANAKVELSMQEKRKQNNSCAAEVKSDLAKISGADVAACDQDPSSSRAVCRQLRAYRINLENCDLAGEAVVTEDLKASLIENAANFNSKLAGLSSQLSKLDCGEKSKDGVCLKPGAFSQVSTSFKQQFASFSEQCPNRLFSKSLPPPKVLAEKAVVSPQPQATEKQKPSGSFFSRFFGGLFKSNKDTNQKASEAERELYSGS